MHENPYISGWPMVLEFFELFWIFFGDELEPDWSRMSFSKLGVSPWPT